MAFDPQAYLKANPDLINNPAVGDPYQHYLNYGKNEGRSLGSPAAATSQIVPGNITAPNQQNIVAAAGQIATNPNTIVSGSNSLATQVPSINPNTPGTNIASNDAKFAPAGFDAAAYVNANPDVAAAIANGTYKSAYDHYIQFGAAEGRTQGNAQPTPTAQATTATASQVVKPEVATYEAQQTQNAVKDAAMTGAVGTVGQNSLIDPNKLTVDTEAVGRGEGALGQALNNPAQQGMEVVDLGTPEGKARAEELGPGNYTDSQATIKGQLAKLSDDFIGPGGEPKIPTWAQGAARGVSKIAAFSGMTGSAATAAMATALHEASLPIAQQEAQFFQTLTIKNLDNRQQSTILKANILANLELANMDARTTAAVNNANAFLQTDLKNLDNEQQARVINTQARVQSILEDAKAVNTQRMFTAQSTNDMNMFYDNLNAQIDMFNASQSNAMSQFNTSETNSMSKFNTEMENQRQEFYKNMQFNIDTSNAKWRQTVTLTESQQKFDAAATDVKNRIGLSVEMLNQLWDRSDAMLDYVWKSSENEADRKSALILAQLQAQTQKEINTANNQNDKDINNANNKNASSIATGQGVGSVVGALVGGIASSSAFTEKLTNWLF